MKSLEDLIADLTQLSMRSHHYCEDTWYSCPKAPEGCANDAEGDECNCGADEHNSKVLEVARNITYKLGELCRTVEGLEGKL